MDVLIIAPSASRKLYQKLSDNFSAKEPNIWAGLLANAVRCKGMSVSIHDMEIEPNIKDIENCGARLILFVVTGQNPNASTASMTGAVIAAKEVRELLPESKIAFVGPHVKLPFQFRNCAPYTYTLSV